MTSTAHLAEALHEAAYRGDLEEVRRLVAAGVPVDAPNKYGRTPLLCITHLGNAQMVRLLLELGADHSPPQKHDYPYYPLHCAASRGYLETCEALLEHGLDVDAPDAHGDTPLMSAAFCTQTKIAAFLLDRGARPDALSDTGWSPLAASISHPALLRDLLGRVGLARALELHPDLLRSAVFVRCEASCRILLEAGAPWRLPERPHHYLVLDAHLDLRHGVKVDALRGIQAALVEAGSPTEEEAAILAVLFAQRHARLLDLPHCLRADEPIDALWHPYGRSTASAAGYRRRLLAAIDLHEAGWGDGPDMLRQLLGFPAAYVARAAAVLARWPRG